MNLDGNCTFFCAYLRKKNVEVNSTSLEINSLPAKIAVSLTV